MTHSRCIGSLDLGSSKVAAGIAAIDPDGAVSIAGIGLADAHGIRRGIVVDPRAARESVACAIAEAESVAGRRLGPAYVALSGSHLHGFNSRGVVTVSHADRIVRAEDLTRAMNAAISCALPPGRDVVYVLPERFLVDGEECASPPVGVTGAQLDVDVYVITLDMTSARDVVACVNQAGVSVADLVPAPLAAAEAVLTEDEKSLGVALVDIGGGATNYAVFDHGVLAHAGVVPIGGDHLTNAAAVELRTSPADAERLKRRDGWAIPLAIDDSDIITVPSLGRCPPRRLPVRLLTDILERGAEELFERLRAELHDARFDRALPAGGVLTGGGSILGGMAYVAERVFGMPVRRGMPRGLGGLADHVIAPALSTVTGLLLHGERHRALAQAIRAAARAS